MAADGSMSARAARPVAVYLLVLALVLEAIPALFGGIGLLSDPYGQPLGMPASWLDGTPFHSFLIPGILLTAVLGLLPLVSAVLLLVRPRWGALAGLERAVGQHGAWMLALASGIGIVVWIVVQVLMLGASHPLQAVIGLMGALILGLALLPEVRRAYAVPRRR